MQFKKRKESQPQLTDDSLRNRQYRKRQRRHSRTVGSSPPSIRPRCFQSKLQLQEKDTKETYSKLLLHGQTDITISTLLVAGLPSVLLDLPVSCLHHPNIYKAHGRQLTESTGDAKLYRSIYLQ